MIALHLDGTTDGFKNIFKSSELFNTYKSIDSRELPIDNIFLTFIAPTT